MKKIVTSVILIIVALIGAFAFSACDTSASSDVATLTMNKRYIREDKVNDTENNISYVFHSDGTGEFTYHYDYDILDSYYESHTHEHYIIHFKYTYVDDDKSAVVCFYDSIERLDGDEGNYTNTKWSRFVSVSKNVLTTVGSSYTFWINEDYLKTIPNFGEEQS